MLEHGRQLCFVRQTSASVSAAVLEPVADERRHGPSGGNSVYHGSCSGVAIRQFALDLERMASACISVQATHADMARVVPVLHDMFDSSRARPIGRAVYARGFGACKLERVIWD